MEAPSSCTHTHKTNNLKIPYKMHKKSTNNAAIRPFPLKAKLQALSIHLDISLLLFALIVAWMYFYLYPSFYFGMSGGVQGLGLMFGVDVILGPLLTFLIFNPTKKRREIVSDLLIIAIVQLSALGYGLNVVYQEHPKLVVVYQYGTTTVVSHREVNEDSALKQLNLADYSKLETVPVVVYRSINGKESYTATTNAMIELNAADKITRDSMGDAADRLALQAIERQHGKVWVLAIMGKYTGAYIVVDKNFNFLGKIGEKPVS